MRHILCKNPDLSGQETSYLTANTAVNDTTIAIKKASEFSTNDYILIGKYGDENTEIAKVASISGNVITVTTGLSYTHNKSDTIQKIPYNQTIVYASSSKDGTYQELYPVKEFKIKAFLHNDADTETPELSNVLINNDIEGKNFDFLTPSEYIYDSSKIEVIGGLAKLKLADDTGLSFNEPFDSATGFTYDNTKAEFTGGLVRQKDQRPTDSALGISYASSINGNWGNGVLTGTANGGASVSGGKLDLTGSVNKWVSYSATGNASNALLKGAIKFKYTPNYSGTPANTQNMVYVGQANINNCVNIYHANSSGYIYISIYSSVGVAIYSGYLTPLWQPVAGTEYEMELDYNIDVADPAHAIRFFINGIQYGLTNTSTGIRANTLTNIWIGSVRGTASVNDFKIRDVLFFDTVQHTADYTSGYTVPENIYPTSTVQCPQFTYSGLGDIQEFTAFSGTDTNSPKYIINDLYWNGVAWVASAGTYAQANTIAEINTNIATLPASDAIIVKAIFNAGATQMSVADLTLEYTGQIYTVGEDPTIETNVALDFSKQPIAFVETSTKPAGNEIKYLVSDDDGTTYRYWDGTSWIESDGTYTQSNTASVINTNISKFLSNRANIEPDDIWTANNYSTGTALCWFKYTFYNSTTQDESELTASEPKQAGAYNCYLDNTLYGDRETAVTLQDLKNYLGIKLDDRTKDFKLDIVRKGVIKAFEDLTGYCITKRIITFYPEKITDDEFLVSKYPIYSVTSLITGGEELTYDTDPDKTSYEWYTYGRIKSYDYLYCNYRETELNYYAWCGESMPEDLYMALLDQMAIMSQEKKRIYVDETGVQTATIQKMSDDMKEIINRYKRYTF